MDEGEGNPFYLTGEWKYEVFLNFRGVDTRDGFTTLLYNTLTEKGIRTFFDDDGLRRGQQIMSSLLRAIEESRVSIVIFSPNYASSAYCLDELVHIIDCCKGHDRLVLPVFVNVDPSEVRYQKGAYAEAFDKHQHHYHVDHNKLQTWCQALTHAANLSGWTIKQGSNYEFTFIRKIIGEVLRTMGRAPLNISNGNHPVGLEHKLRDVISYLKLESDEKTITVGIWGMGSIGKTTLAQAVYHSISGRFEGICFLADVAHKSREFGLVKLQETLLSHILEENNIKFQDQSKIIPTLKKRLRRKKILLILDDVDCLDQLQSLAGNCDWFGSGSRVVITTRDRHLLEVYGVDRTYEVSELSIDEALKLFYWKAFENIYPDPVYENLSAQLVRYSHGVPLVLEIMGSQLFEKPIVEWKSVLNKCQRASPQLVHSVLLVTYSSLDDDVKRIFLDIACCLNGEKQSHVTDLLQRGRGGGYRSEYALQVLISKCLVKIDGDRIKMHDLIRDLGREVVRMESTRPSERSRIWYYEDILQILQNEEGAPCVEIMKIDLPEDKVVDWNGNGFRNMKKLKILIVKNACFSCVPKVFPDNLRVLEWKGCFDRASW